jgi:hypothetical protein
MWIDSTANIKACLLKILKMILNCYNESQTFIRDLGTSLFQTPPNKRPDLFLSGVHGDPAGVKFLPPDSLGAIVQ